MTLGLSPDGFALEATKEITFYDCEGTSKKGSLFEGYMSAKEVSDYFRESLKAADADDLEQLTSMKGWIDTGLNRLGKFQEDSSKIVGKLRSALKTFAIIPQKECGSIFAPIEKAKAEFEKSLEELQHLFKTKVKDKDLGWVVVDTAEKAGLGA